jgi:hypothetical protein
MNKFKFKHISLFLFIVFSLQFNCNALKSVTIKNTFASTEYEIVLYDVRSIIESYATHVDNTAKDVSKHIFRIKPDIKDAFDFDVCYEDASNLLPESNNGNVKINYDIHRINTHDFTSYKTGKINYKQVLFADKYSAGEYYVPVLDGVANDRVNLFDLFSLDVDQSLFNFGVKEQVEHTSKKQIGAPGEKQEQITLLGEIKIKDKGEIIYFEAGFFQYTFFKHKNGKYFCYHRAFRPIRSYQLIRLNRAGTKMIWCKVVAEILSIWPFDVDSEENRKYFEQYLNTAETILKACQNSELNARLRVALAV